MASTQAARTDTIIIMVDGQELKLSVTTRAPISGQQNPPTPTQLARIRTGCVMQYTINYRKAVEGNWLPETYDKDLKSPIRTVAESSEDNQQIQPSIADPYVTVWQMGNWGSNQPPSLTLHDWDSGNEILSLSAICEVSNDRLREIFNSGNGIKGMQLLYLSSFRQVQRQEHDDTVGNEPTNTTRIGQHADSLPDTPQKGQNVPSKLIPLLLDVKAWIRGAKLNKGFLFIESGKANKPDYKTACELTDKPYNYKADSVEFEDKAMVAYPLESQLRSGAWNDGNVYIDIPLPHGKSYRVSYEPDKEFGDWKILRDRLAVDWENVQANQVYPVSGVISHVVVKYANSEDGKRQFRNLYGFYQLQSTDTAQKPRTPKTKTANTGHIPAHHDLDEFFGEDGHPEYYGDN